MISVSLFEWRVTQTFLMVELYSWLDNSNYCFCAPTCISCYPYTRPIVLTSSLRYGDLKHSDACAPVYFSLFLVSSQHRLPIFFSGARSISVMELADRAVGLLLSVISLSIFTYYTFWIIILVS